MTKQNPIYCLVISLICLLSLVACGDEASGATTTLDVANTQGVAVATTVTLPTLTSNPAVVTTTPPTVSKTSPMPGKVAMTTIAVAGITPVERGKNLFLLVGCSACHGLTAQGAYGPKIAATKLSYSEVLLQVRNPGASKGNIMVPYSQEELLDSQVADIYTFLQSLK